MIPLGPLNGKSMGTTISPWIVTLDALEPFRVQGRRPDATAAIPAHLEDPERSTFAVELQVEVLAGQSAAAATITGASRLDESLHWTPRQMAAHAASAGSALRTGDLLATGTVSGPGAAERGCLLELTEGGAVPFALADGSARTYLQDGDTVRMTARAGDDGSGVGWGECVGQLLPARPFRRCSASPSGGGPRSACSMGRAKGRGEGQSVP